MKIPSDTRLIDLCVCDLIEIIRENSSNIRIAPNSKRWLTIDELCREYSFRKNTVYVWVNQNKIPVIKKGKRLIFDRIKVEEWLLTSSKVNICVK